MPKKDDLIDSDSASEKNEESGSEGEEEEYVVEEIRDKRMVKGKVSCDKNTVKLFALFIALHLPGRILAEMERLR